MNDLNPLVRKYQRRFGFSLVLVIIAVFNILMAGWNLRNAYVNASIAGRNLVIAKQLNCKKDK